MNIRLTLAQSDQRYRAKNFCYSRRYTLKDFVPSTSFGRIDFSVRLSFPLIEASRRFDVAFDSIEKTLKGIAGVKELISCRRATQNLLQIPPHGIAAMMNVYGLCPSRATRFSSWMCSNSDRCGNEELRVH